MVIVFAATMICAWWLLLIVPLVFAWGFWLGFRMAFEAVMSIRKGANWVTRWFRRTYDEYVAEQKKKVGGDGAEDCGGGSSADDVIDI